MNSWPGRRCSSITNTASKMKSITETKNVAGAGVKTKEAREAKTREVELKVEGAKKNDQMRDQEAGGQRKRKKVPVNLPLKTERGNGKLNITSLGKKGTKTTTGKKRRI